MVKVVLFCPNELVPPCRLEGVTLRHLEHIEADLIVIRIGGWRLVVHEERGSERRRNRQKAPRRLIQVKKGRQIRAGTRIGKG